MSIPMTPDQVPQASDNDLRVGFVLAVVMFGAHPAPGTCEAVQAEMARRKCGVPVPDEGNLFALFPQLSPGNTVDGDGAGNLG